MLGISSVHSAHSTMLIFCSAVEMGIANPANHAKQLSRACVARGRSKALVSVPILACIAGLGWGATHTSVVMGLIMDVVYFRLGQRDVHRIFVVVFIKQCMCLRCLGV